jgi:hypothetical protein
MWVAYSVNIESMMTAVMRFKWRRNGRGESAAAKRLIPIRRDYFLNYIKSQK